MSNVSIKRWIPRIIVLALLVGAGVFLWIKKPWVKAETPITYQTVPVGKGTIAAQVTANGTLSARGTVQVGAQVSGRVVEIHADFNDKVTKGQVIAKLDASVLQAQITSAAASVALANANVAHSERARADASQFNSRSQAVVRARERDRRERLHVGGDVERVGFRHAAERTMRADGHGRADIAAVAILAEPDHRGDFGR